LSSGRLFFSAAAKEFSLAKNPAADFLSSRERLFFLAAAEEFSLAEFPATGFSSSSGVSSAAFSSK